MSTEKPLLDPVRAAGGNHTGLRHAFIVKRCERNFRSDPVTLIRAAETNRADCEWISRLLQLRMSSLRVLKTLVTERLTAAAEEILVLVERVMVEHEEQLIRRYRPAEERTSPDTEPPESRTLTDVQQFEGFDLQQQPDQEQLQPPTIKQEQEEEQEEEQEGEQEDEQEEVWTSPDNEAPQMKVEQDTKDFIYAIEYRSEQPQVESGLSEEVLKVELKDEDILPNTSSGLTDAPQLDPPADLPPPAATQTEDTGGSTSCKVCGKTFSYRGFLINHAEMHAVESCLCGVCGKLLPTSQNLLEHLQTHIKPHVCQSCGKTFRKRIELEEHTRCHTGERPFICTVCGKSCSRKRNLVLHMRTHTGEKPYRCSVCGRCFNVTSALIRHSRTHTGEKPYSCRFCFKTFASSSEMKTHLRTHTGEKPFKCNVCGKSFLLSTPLKNHMKHHTEERPYYCSKCRRSFCDVYVLRRHMETHNKNKS
ncbi:uncharacterized protein [Pagrus major]|uniref:uncharacterized protein n=1 Tax=Pagrus major TaxID=143350 RepID=UPI003CC8B375